MVTRRGGQRGLSAVLLVMVHTATCLHPSLRPPVLRSAAGRVNRAPMSSAVGDSLFTWWSAQEEVRRTAYAEAESAARAAAAEFARTSDRAAASVARSLQATEEARAAEKAVTDARAAGEGDSTLRQARAEAELEYFVSANK